MKFVLHTISPSPHQLPLAKELVQILGEENFRYIYEQPLTEERRHLGWGDKFDNEKWVMNERRDIDSARFWMNQAEVVLTGIRRFDLIRDRVLRGYKTWYMSERWFKPISISRLLNGFGRNLNHVKLPGWIRLMHPKYFNMLRALRELTHDRGTSVFRVFPIGVHARRDMRLIGVPEDRMTTWGYFVESSRYKVEREDVRDELRVLWVGRLLNWKHVDTIVQAVKVYIKMRDRDGSLPRISLDIYGRGPEETCLRKLAERYEEVIKFYPPVPIVDVRKLMRQHDVYILASDGMEGWGATLNEALEEGMVVLGTHEAGSSGTILSADRQFKTGDVLELARLLGKVARGCFKPTGIGDWGVSTAARKLMELVG